MITLTEHQQEAVSKIHTYLLNSRGIALLSGIAGTGKSTCVNEIIKEFKRRGQSVWLSGTTHKSVEVVSTATGFDPQRTSTVHSFLNMVPDTSGYNLPMIVNQKKEMRTPNTTDLLIVEEFSMLTEDVINILLDKQARTNMRILFVGDASQLILNDKDIDILKLKDVTAFLTKPMRQRANSHIAVYSQMVSKYILGLGVKPDIPYGVEVIKHTDHKSFVNAWKESKTDSKAILAYQNTTVNAYNRNIQKLFRGQAEEYAIGNKVILRSYVKATDTVGSSKSIPNRKEVVIEGLTKHEGYWDVKSDCGAFKIPKNKTWLSEYLKPYAERRDWEQYYKIKESFALVHHADAMTVHASQGESMDEVFIDARDMAAASDGHHRLAYVGISRARVKAHLFIGKDRDYKNFKMRSKDL